MKIEVVAALIFQQGRLLACQRSASGPFPLKWEFPGGKVEDGEEPEAALKRELREELGIEVRSATEFWRYQHGYLDGTEVELRFYRVDDYQGTVKNRVFNKILWSGIQALPKLDFLDADLELVKSLARRELVL